MRPFRCTYEGCGKAFKSISHLKDHTQSIHMKLKPFECVFCKSLFSRNSSLKYHIKSIHAQLLAPDGSLSELAQEQLKILREGLGSQPPKETTPVPAPAQAEAKSKASGRKDKVHLKCEVNAGGIAAPGSAALTKPAKGISEAPLKKLGSLL